MPASARPRLRAAVAVAATGLLIGCAPTARSAVVQVDGSSTMFPLTEAIAEEYVRARPDARVTVGISGTGGGLKRLCRGEIEIAAASRPISAEEHEACRTADLTYFEVPVAYDGITVVVHPANTWVDHLSVAELGRLWRHEAQGRVTRWSDLRPSFPDREIHLFGAGVDSGTFDYFTEAVTGTPRDSRGDYTSSEDDNTLVEGVAGDVDALGFFGFAYYAQYRDRLRAVPLQTADTLAAIAPSIATIADGSYRPLSRPVFLYVAADAYARPAVRHFVDWYVARAQDLAGAVGYVPLAPRTRAAVETRLALGTTGSLYEAAPATVPLDVRLGLD